MASPEPVRLAVGTHVVEVDLAHGARATSWTYAGHELLARHGDDPVEYGMYPMAPWAGRVRDNLVKGPDGPVTLPVTYAEWALHGTVLRSAAEPVERVQEPGHALLRARVDDHPGWPWPMAVEITWQVREASIEAVLEVQAPGVPFPAVVGWHPWFRRRLSTGEPLMWSFCALSRAERGADHLPTGALLPPDLGERPLDDAFVVPDGRAVLEWAGALRVDVESDANWFVVYDELPDVVCVEPQSGPPDGLRAGSVRPAVLAAPGRPVRLRTRWSLALC